MFRYDPRSSLLEARWQMVRLAIWIGFASILGVVVATLVPHHVNRYVDDGAVYLLAAVGAAGNAGFGVLARRWRGRRAGEPLLLAWGVGLIGLVASLTYVGGGYASDYYLLYFLVIPFLAATQGPRTQVPLFALLALGYAIAVWAVPLHPSPGDLLLHLGVLVGAEALGWYLAAALRAEEMRRARLQAEADLKHVLAVEANHRIENNLQLVADLLSFEAARPEASLRAVVDVTVSRVQAVAAVHRLLAADGDGQIQTRSVLEQVLGLLTERLGSESRIRARVEGSLPDLDPQRATWLADAVNELATNAIVHGLGPNGGRLILRLEQGQRCRVLVEDDGAGCPGHVEGLGLGLVRRLVEQGLQGELCIRSEPSGTTAEIFFPTKVKEVAQ